MWRPGKLSILVLEQIDTLPDPGRPPDGSKNAPPEWVGLRSGYALPSPHPLRRFLIKIAGRNVDMEAVEALLGQINLSTLQRLGQPSS